MQRPASVTQQDTYAEQCHATVLPLAAQEWVAGYGLTDRERRRLQAMPPVG